MANANEPKQHDGFLINSLVALVATVEEKPKSTPMPTEEESDFEMARRQA